MKSNVKVNRKFFVVVLNQFPFLKTSIVVELTI